MSEDLGGWLAILGITATGFVTRGSFIVFGAHLKLPPAAEQALRYAPAAVLGALIVPALLLKGGHADLTLGNQRLLAALLAGLVMWRTQSMMATIAAGMAALTALRLFA
jgi:branched-subunit amino acid transport protein